MEGSQLERLARSLSAGNSRRGLLAGTVAIALGVVAGERPWAAAAKQNGKKGRRKHHKPHKRKQKRQNAKSPATPANAATAADASCPANANPFGFTGASRFAQTFVAQRSGQLTNASIVIAANGEGADFDLEIHDLDATGGPLGQLLASTRVFDVARTNFGDSERPITGVFSKPATVVAGHSYALIVSETNGDGYMVQVVSGTTAVQCATGHVFVDVFGNGNFISLELDDLVFATSVTG